MLLWLKRGALMAIGLGFTLGCHGAPRATFPTPAAALEHLGQQTSCSRAIEGDADLVVSSALFNLRAKLLYMAEAPDKVRFDIYSSFGITLSTLTSNGQNFALYSLDEKRFWYGPAKTCNLQKFTRVPIPPFALVEILRGRAPVLAHEPGSARIRFKQSWFGRGHYVVTVRGAHETTEKMTFGVPPEDWNLPLSEQRLRLLSVRVKQAGELLYKVELSDYRAAHRAESELSLEEKEMGILPQPPSGPVCETELPGTLKFSIPGTAYSLKIENNEVAHNPALHAGAFTQPVPQGVVSEYSDCPQ